MFAPRSLFDDAQFLSQESKKQRPTVDLSVSQSLARLVYRWLEARRGAAIRGTTAPGPKIKNTVMPIQKPHRDSFAFVVRCLAIFFSYRMFHLRMFFLKGLKMSENQYVDKKKDSSIITKPHHLT